MASGSFAVTTSNQYITGSVSWNSTANVSGNYSTVTATLRLSRTNSGYTTSGSGGFTMTINGSSYTNNSQFTITQNSNTLMVTHTATVYHNSDGAKSITISAGGSLNSPLTMTTQSGTATLDTIPRASSPTLSSSSTAVGAALTINTNRVSSAFTHTLTYTINGATGTIATNVGTSTTWTIPKSLANSIVSSTSATGSIVCTTYNGSSSVGSKTIPFTVTIPDTTEFKPTISKLTVAEGGTGLGGVFVQSKSKFKIDVTASGAYASSISSYEVLANNAKYTANSSTTGYLTSSGTNTISAKVTDSRGRSTTVTTTVNVLAYSDPAVSTFNVSRCDSDGTLNDEGANAKVTVIAAISAVGNSNSKSFKIRYKKIALTTWTEITLSNASYTVNTSQIISDIDVDSAYDFEFVATDYFTSIKRSHVLSTAFTLVDYRAGGKGISFGEVATQDGFSVNMDANFKKGLMLNGSQIVERGSNANGDFVKFADGTLICSAYREWASVPVSSAWGAMFTSGKLDGGSTPATFVGAWNRQVSISPTFAWACWLYNLGETSVQTDKTWGGVGVMRPTTATIAVGIHFLGIGRWK